MAADDRMIYTYLLNDGNLFSKKIRNINTGEIKKRKFNSNVSIKIEHPFHKVRKIDEYI